MERKTAWWDKLGKPQYGVEMVIRASRNIVNFDPYFSEKLTSIYGGWMERLVSDDWTLNPAPLGGRGTGYVKPITAIMNSKEI